MQKILPFIWFETQAKEAADWYVGIFPNSHIISKSTLPGTPSGDTDIVSLSLNGTEFQFMSAGAYGERNPSFSYMVACETVEEVDALFAKLSEGAEIMMPLEEYPFSKKYVWLKDKFGVSWQIMHDGGMKVQRITTSLMFTKESCGRAEEAMNFYCKLFGGHPLEGHISRYTAGQEPNKEGNINYARFELAGHEFVIMESADEHVFSLNEMQSLVVRCQDQAEMDGIWDKLSAVPESEQCGWLKDKFGVSWQMTSYRMEEMMTTGTPEQLARVTQAFMPMKKLDFAEIEKAFDNIV